MFLNDSFVASLFYKRSVKLYLMLHFKENSVPKTGTEEVSLKLNTLTSQPEPGQEPLCLKPQTEGATAKVNKPTHISIDLFKL